MPFIWWKDKLTHKVKFIKLNLFMLVKILCTVISRKKNIYPNFNK